MKFLHLADLHIGKTVNGFSMIEDQNYVLAQIIALVQADRPDAVLIAGDVYDRALPAVEAVHLFDDFLTALAQEKIAVLLIPGNHDSADRLAYANRLLRDKGLFLCGSYQDSLYHVTLTDVYGPLHFWLLPFIRPSMLPNFRGAHEADSYSAALSSILEHAAIDYSVRNVLLSHQFFTAPGLTPLRSESELNPVGGLDAVDASLVSRFDYVALGHLHGAQRVGAEHIRYAGSPLKYSFSEWQQRKSVTMVELRKKGQLDWSPVPLKPLHDLRQIKGPLDHLISPDVLAQANPEDYLRVILTDEEELVDPMGKLRSIYPNVMALDFENKRTSIDPSILCTDSDIQEGLSTYALFSQFFLERSGSVMTEEQSSLIRALLDREEMA